MTLGNITEMIGQKSARNNWTTYVTTRHDFVKANTAV